MKWLRSALENIRKLWTGSTVTLIARHGECGQLGAYGRTWGESESTLRFKAASRGLDVDWKTLRPDPDMGSRPPAWVCMCGQKCVVKRWVIRDAATGLRSPYEGWACNTAGCYYNPSERLC